MKPSAGWTTYGTRMIVIEYELADVRIVTIAANTDITWAEIAIQQVVRQNRFITRDRFAIPGAILPVRGDDDPFFAHRLPTLLPVREPSLR